VDGGSKALDLKQPKKRSVRSLKTPGASFDLDTNAYADWPREKRWLRTMLAGMVYIPFVVVAELRAGFACGERAAENLESFEPFMQSEFV